MSAEYALSDLAMQAFQPDLAICDFALMGGGALADKLGTPKVMLSVPGFLPPVSGYAYGAGSTFLATVPQWSILLPQTMISSRAGRALAAAHSCIHHSLHMFASPRVRYIQF